MANDLNQSLYIENEIDLKEIFKILLKSKKLILSTILIFTTASIIYSLSLKPSYLTSTKLEIGYYEMSDGAQKLIEKPSNLISGLKVLIMKNPDDKFNQNVSMNSFEGKLINLETTSSSVEQNEDLLNEVIRYINKRHSNLAILTNVQKKAQISNEIETLESKISFIKGIHINNNQMKKLTINRNLENVKSEVSFIKAKQFDKNRLKQSKIKDRIAQLKSDLPFIDLEISQLEKLIIDDTYNLSLLTRNEKTQTERATNSPTLEQIIFSYNSEINDLNAKKYMNVLETKSLNNQFKILENSTLQSDELFNLEQYQKTLENELIALENVTLQSDELFNLKQKQKTLENQVLMLTSQNIVQTSPIMDLKTTTIKPKTQLIISLGIILGFTTSIFLVFIRGIIKSYRESEA
jgi:capsular polysaccharide biosynthesis protein